MSQQGRNSRGTLKQSSGLVLLLWSLMLVVCVAVVLGLQRGRRRSRADPAGVVVEEDELTASDAARIIGCSPEEVSGFLNGRSATLELAEQLAVEHYRWRAHVNDASSYWLTLKQAAPILGVSVQRVKQCLATGEVPHVVHRDGVRLMRRKDLEALAAAHDLSAHE